MSLFESRVEKAYINEEALGEIAASSLHPILASRPYYAILGTEGIPGFRDMLSKKGIRSIRKGRTFRIDYTSPEMSALFLAIYRPTHFETLLQDGDRYALALQDWLGPIRLQVVRRAAVEFSDEEVVYALGLEHQQEVYRTAARIREAGTDVPRSRVWVPNDRQLTAVIQALADRVSYREIAASMRELGRPAGQVAFRRWLCASGRDMRVPRGRPRNIQRDKEIAEAHAAGEGALALSERFNISIARVYQVLRAHSLDPNTEDPTLAWRRKLGLLLERVPPGISNDLAQAIEMMRASL